MDLLDRYNTSTKHATEGVKMDLGNGDWITLAYAGASNPEYAATVRDVLKPYRKQIKRAEMDPEKDRKLLAIIYAKCVVKGWGGKGWKGKKCTEANVIELFTKLPELFLDIQDMASNLEYYAQEYEAEATKNS